MKDRILQRVRRATEHRAAVELPFPPAALELAASEAVSLFKDRLSANGGEVVWLTQAELPGWLSGLAAGFAGVAVGDTVPADWAVGLNRLPPEQAPLGVSLALAAVAETGSLLLASPDGRRTQLLPPTHVVLVPAGRLYTSLAQALALHSTPELPAALALHSGPSKSADIGQVMVKGVHGPGRLIAVLLQD